MHQIGSLICDQHNKLMVRMTILFLLCTYTIIMHQHLQRKSLATHYIDGKSEMEEWLQWRSAMEPIHWKKWKSRRVQQTWMNYIYQLYNYHIMCIELSWLVIKPYQVTKYAINREIWYSDDNNSHAKDMQVVASNITFRLPGQTRFSCTKLRDMCMMNLLNDIITLWKQCLHICTHIVPGTAKQITDFSLNCKLAQTSSNAHCCQSSG